jgi:hypothetical protein
MRHTRKKRELTLHNLLAKNSPFSWRSLFAFFLIIALSTILLCVGKLSEMHWVELVQWIGGFFITGETAKKFAGSSKNLEETREDQIKE